MFISKRPRLSRTEFRLLRSLSKQPWQTNEPVLWRRGTNWATTYTTNEMREAAFTMERRGLITGTQLPGFDPKKPGLVVKTYRVSQRGERLLARANLHRPDVRKTTLPPFFRAISNLLRIFNPGARGER